MSYTLNDKEALLPQAIAALLRRPNVPGQCLGYVRSAVAGIGLSLPPASLLIDQTGHSTALACYRELVKDPAKYGWVKVEQPGAHPCKLAFFDRCGVENNGALIAGHIALRQGNTLYASNDYSWGPYWESRLLGYFIPLG